NCSITSGLKLESTASIRLRIEDEEYLSAGVGNGGFDAFMNAIKKLKSLQRLEIPRLLDYEVRIPKGGHADALTECTITWGDEKRSFKTRGVHSNQVFAAMAAAIRMFNILYFNDKQTERAPE
ncbi:MAG: 2-isopropylmalate synthase, partial [Gammaproteobacteria bacterium]|nr:2-isopropylmalate synthase [Gammaproteobacteria bacterium]